MKQFINFWLYVMLVVSVASCQKDNIVLIDPINTEEDDITNIEFAQTVYVTYSLNEDASVTGTNEDFMVTVSGNDVTIVYAGEEYVMYELSGCTNDGFFKLYSTKKQGITLNDVSITNPNGSAINVQGTVLEPNKGKRTFVVVNGDNTLYDGETYSDTPSGEDEKATFFSEGQLIFSGSGTLSVQPVTSIVRSIGTLATGTSVSTPAIRIVTTSTSDGLTSTLAIVVDTAGV